MFASAAVLLASRNPNVAGIQWLLDDALFSTSLVATQTEFIASTSRLMSNARVATRRFWKFLSAYEYLNPTVPEINDIVPLPPAQLPPWDGKFKWLEEHKANVPPRLPTEERIAEMARAKGLDPKTGRPLRAAK